jgi:hypothetical protein
MRTSSIALNPRKTGSGRQPQEVVRPNLTRDDRGRFPEASHELQKDGRGLLEWGPIAGGAAPSGNLGLTIGEATATNPVTGERRYSKYITVWKRQPNGTWLYVIDGGNARPAPN